MRQSSVVFATAALMAAIAGCGKNDSQFDSDAGLLGNTSAEAKAALSSPVSYELNEDNFAKWENAERNLDRIPSSDLAPIQTSGGSAVDRAVARLEASPRAKRAIEDTGLSIRDFVLETMALAQSVRASETGGSSTGSGVSPGNFAFVEHYRDRIQRSGLGTDLVRRSGDTAVTDPNTAAELAAANADRTADSLGRSSDSVNGSGVGSRDIRNRRDSLRDPLSDTLPIRMR